MWSKNKHELNVLQPQEQKLKSQKLLMQEEGPYGASDRLDHPYGWTVVGTTSMYSK